MEPIKNWAFSLCITAVTATIVQMLAPKGNMEKVIRMTTRIFVLSVLVAPVFMNFDFKNYVDTTVELKTANYANQFSLAADEMLKKELSVQIGEMIKTELEKAEVFPNNVSVSMVSVDGNLEIEHVRVILNSENKIKETDVRYHVGTIADCSVIIEYSEDA